MSTTSVLIVSTPFQYTYGPSLAPALLKACLEKENITATAWDLAAEFNHKYTDHPYYEAVTAWMTSPELQLTKEEFSWYTDIVKDYASRIVDHFNPSHLAISVMTISGQRFTEDLCFHVKTMSDISIVVGGSGADILAHQFNKRWYQVLIDSYLVDTAIIGEGEFSFAYVISNNISGAFHVEQLSNAQLADVPIPSYTDYDLSIYPKNSISYISFSYTDISENLLPWTITASKGCVRNCTFCDVGRIWPKFRFRPGARVAEEIIDLHQRYGAKFFSFTDSLLNGGLRPMFEMNSVLAATIPNTIKYESQAIFRSERDMPEKYFEVMARAGCYHVNIGLESGSESVRQHMGKHVADADIDYSARMFLKYGILQTWNIVVGYPTETDEDFQKTIDLINHWFDRAEGKIQFTPIDTFRMLSGVPITETSLYTDLEIHQELVNGYSDFAWTTGLNPNNTYEVRARRFIEVCQLLKDKNSSNKHVTDELDKRISRTQRRVNWVNEHKQKKFFAISQG